MLSGPVHSGTRTWGRERLGLITPTSNSHPFTCLGQKTRHGVPCGPRFYSPLHAGIRGCTRDSSRGPGNGKGEGALRLAPDYFWLRSRGCLLPVARARTLTLSLSLTHTLSHIDTRAHAHTHAHIFSLALSLALLCLFSNLYFCLKIAFSLSTARLQALSRADRAHTAPLHHPSPPPGLPERERGV